MRLSNAWQVTKKELIAYFGTPTAYIVLVIFLLLWEFLFFRNAFLIGEASVRSLFEVLPWMLLFVVPAVTMGSICQEKNDGTLELLLTHPVKDMEIIIGKFIGSFMFIGFALLFTIPIAVSFSLFGNLDWGIFWGQFLASIFLSWAMISIGIFISSILNNTISSLLMSALIIFLFILAGTELLTGMTPLFLSPVLEQLSLTTHFGSMARGVIDIRDVWYFLSFTVVFVSLAYVTLLKGKYGNRKKLYVSYQVGVWLFVVITILSNIVGSWIPGRIDLTSGKLYTLTDATKNTLGNLKDIIDITLYASNELPIQVQPVLRDTKDLLRDYQTYGRGSVVVSYQDPTNKDVASEARSLGIIEVQFNVMGQQELQVKKGYFGLVVSYAGDHEVIPYIQDTSDLEYQLTSFIKKMTTTIKKKVVFLSGNGEKSIQTDYSSLYKELVKQFDVTEIALEQQNPTLPEDTALIVVAGPSKKIDETTRKILSDFLNKGGSELFLLDAVTVSPQGLSASLNEENFGDFIQMYGVSLNKDLVYDLRSNEILSFNTGNSMFFSSYPFWPRILVKDTSSIVTRNIPNMVYPWGSSLSLDTNVLQGKGLKSSLLFTTSKAGGVVSPPFNILPDQQPPTSNLGEKIVAVSLQPDQNTTGRMIIVGNSEFLKDDIVQRNPENLAFALSSISYLTQEESLASIQLKTRMNQKLLFENDTQKTILQYGNMGAAFIIPIIVAILFAVFRKRLQSRKYFPPS